MMFLWFLQFVRFLELLHANYDKLWFLNKPNKSLNLEHCLDVARLQKPRDTKPWLNDLDN